jgi:hypothetical protein
LDIDVESVRSSSAGMAEGIYDVAILSGNWDSRSTALVGSKIAVDTAIVCTLLQPSVSTVHEGNARRVLDFANSHSTSVRQLDVDRRSQYSVVRTMAETIHGVARRIRRPVRVVIDLAGMSRFTALGLMAWGFRSGIVVEFSFSYAVATSYEIPARARDTPHLFRSGDWLPTPIPGLGWPGATGTLNRLVVSVGFEGKRTRRLVDLLEPDELVLFRSQSPIAANNETLEIEMEPLRSAVHQSRLSEVSAPIGDVQAAVEQFLRTTQARSDRDRSVSILLAGPKITSLAAAIASMKDNSIRNVFYVQSERHEPVDVKGVAEYLLVNARLPWSGSVLARG